MSESDISDRANGDCGSRKEDQSAATAGIMVAQVLGEVTTASIGFALLAALSLAPFTAPRTIQCRRELTRPVGVGDAIGLGRSRALPIDRCSEALRLYHAYEAKVSRSRKGSSSAIAIGYSNLASEINSVITDSTERS